MRVVPLVIGIGLMILGGYPPFSMWTVLIGLAVTLFGVFSYKKVKK